MADDAEHGIVAGLADLTFRHDGRHEHGRVNRYGIKVWHIEGIHKCHVQRHLITGAVVFHHRQIEREVIVCTYQLGQ